MNRNNRRIAWTWLLLLSVGQFPWVAAAEPLRPLKRYPILAETFPFGFWYSQAPMDENLAGAFQETYQQRRLKLFHHLAQRYTNVLITANRVAAAEPLDVAGQYGIRLVSAAEFLHSHVNHAGEVTGEATMEQVLEQAAAHATRVKDHDQLLAYLVFDEPRPQVSAKIQQVCDIFQKTDPRHPAIYTHSDMPLDETRWPAQRRLLQSRDVILSDCYSIAARSGRDPWLYGDVYLPSLRRANTEALQWPIIQAFTKPYTIWALPTPAELRVMVYHTVASGAKGMFFFTTNQAYLGSWARRHWFYRGSGNPWFGREPLMEEIGRIGAHLTTAGPLLVPLRFAPRYPVDVGAVDAPSAAPETFGAYVLGGSGEVGSGGLRRAGELRRAAIHVGAFTGEDYDVLVIHNNDPWSSRRAAVTLRKPRAQVLDLQTLQLVRLEPSAGGATFQVGFQPGDGRLYLAGSARAVEAGRAAVLRRRYQHQARLLMRDTELAQRGGVGTTEVVKLAGLAGRAEEPQVALERIRQARVALEQAQAGALKFAQAWRHVEAARGSFDRMYAAFCSAPIQPIDEQSSPALRELERQLIQLSRSFVRIENGLRVGQWDPTQAYVLERESRQLETAVRDYRPHERVEKRIAVIACDGGDPETQALAKRLSWMFTEVSMVTALPDGRIVDAAGEVVNLMGWDLVWFHISGRSTAARVRYCESAELAASARSTAAVEQLKGYSAAGGGLVLSGLAGCLVTDLEWEVSPPNNRYWGTMLVPGHGPSRHGPAAQPAVKSLGLRPLQPAHPIFAGLPAEGFSTMEYNAAELVTAAVWHRPPSGGESWPAPFWPQRGTVLAGYWSDGLELATDYAVVVEYLQKGRSRALLLGGGFDPRVSTDRPRTGSHYDQFVRNVVQYLTSAQ